MNRTIGLLVSGHCEVAAVPILARRLLHEQLDVYDVRLATPIRKMENQLLQRGSDLLERTIERLRRRHDAILVLIDLEDDCPAEFAPVLQARCEAACPDKPIAFVAAWRELETWFVWSAESLLGVTPPADPEAKRDAKKFLRHNGRPNYNERADAPGLAAGLDIEHVRARSDSFRVFCDRVAGLVG